MEFIERKLKGVFEIILNPHIDERGFFMRSFDDIVFKEAGLNFNWVQENHSRTLKKGTIRGLHFQLPPFEETKLIRCIRGKIFDVYVDLRKNSPTFGQWESIELSEDYNKMILIPRGFAHGYFTLNDNCDVLYKVDNFYSREHDSGINWNDSDLNICWPSKDVIISNKDKSLISFKKFIELNGGI